MTLRYEEVAHKTQIYEYFKFADLRLGDLWKPLGDKEPCFEHRLLRAIVKWYVVVSQFLPSIHV